MAEARQYVVWGSSGHALVVDEIIRSQGSRTVALFDNSPTARSPLIGVELLGGKAAWDAWAEKNPDRSRFHALVAIGSGQGRDRLRIQEVMVSAGLLCDELVHSTAFVADNAHLGAGTQVLAMGVVAAGVQMGDACVVNHKASVDHGCSIGDGVFVAPGATILGEVSVGDCSTIGAGAVVLPKLRIGRDCMVGAGAIITKDVPDGVVIVGNPGRIIGMTEC